MTVSSVFMVLLVAAGWIQDSGKTVEDLYPSGKKKLEYSVNEAGQKHGRYIEYYETGRQKVKAKYRNGLLEGAYTIYYETGSVHIKATYRKGKLHGRYAEETPRGKVAVSGKYKDGKRHGKFAISRNGKRVSNQIWKEGLLRVMDGRQPFSRSKAEITKEIKTILAAAAKDPKDPKELDRKEALRRLKAYRYLVGVPYESLTLHEEYNQLADAAADICQRNGELSHEPKNPGMPESEYRRAYKGASSCNLHKGGRTMTGSVDRFMYDSDENNIARVGHRRSALDPRMGRVGFGRSPDEQYAAMHVLDWSNRKPPAYDFVAYPARGYMPLKFFGEEHAWNLSLNAGKYSILKGDTVQATIHRLDENYVAQPDSALPLNFSNVAAGRRDIWLIFRPSELDMSPNARYLVEVKGIRKKDKAAPDVKYIVEFFSLEE